MLASFAEAEDLVQDTMERAWKARESYRGDAPLKPWLYSIATNACLNALTKRRTVSLPQLEHEPAGASFSLIEADAAAFVTPAPDERLFPDPAEVAEGRETVALAFVALLQRVPPRQRAALLMKDVLGWSAEEIASALGLTPASVNSALHRGREATARLEPSADEPTPSTVRSFVRAWEAHDLDGLVALLREDVELAMPPHTVWFRGSPAVTAFFQAPRFAAFWSSGVRLICLRANGMPAFAFYRADAAGTLTLHSVMVARFRGERVAGMEVFIGPTYFSSFGLPLTLDRTVSPAPIVLEGKGVVP